MLEESRSSLWKSHACFCYWHGKTNLFDRFCAGEMDEHIDTFLDLRATKDAVIRSGVAMFQHIYQHQIPLWGMIWYNMFSRKGQLGWLSSPGAARLIKPETLPPTEGAAAQHSLSAYLQTRGLAEHVFGPLWLWVDSRGSWFWASTNTRPHGSWRVALVYKL